MRSPWSRLAIFLAFSMALGVTPGGSQTSTVATGDELQVNTYTTGNQWFPSASVLANGDFVVVWQTDGSDNGDSSGSSVQGRRYTSDGEPIGGPFLVNAYTTGSQQRPAIAPRPDGGFVVVWESDGSADTDTAGSSIQGQRFDAGGALLGDAFQVNTYTTSSQSAARVAVAADGSFVVVWTSDGSDNGDTSQASVQGQRFAADATPQSSQFLVNTYTSSQQTQPTVAIDDDGDFVVAWRSLGSDNGDTLSASVQGRRFAADGEALSEPFLVNTYTSSAQEDPSISMAPDGRFVVAWASFGSDNGDTSNHSIQAQRFSSAGVAIGDELLVNTYTTSTQRVPSVAVDAAGDFVVTWRSYGSDNGDTSRNSVQGQRFTADGVPVGGQFLVNTYGLNSQQEPSVAVSDAGDFVVAWHSIGSTADSDGYAVLAQPFRVTADLGDRVFQDLDSDGRQSAADLGAAGITVHLRDDLGDLVASTTTDSDGAFLLQPKIALQGAADDFFLEFDPGPSAIFTTADVGDDDSLDSDADALGKTPTVTIATAGTRRLDLDAGLIDITPVIGDRVWHDANLDGVQQLGEVGLSGVTVRLLDLLDTEVDSETTDGDGLYAFSGVASGTYRLEIELPAGAALADQEVGSNTQLDSDFDPATRRTDPFAYAATAVRRDLDAAVVLPGNAQVGLVYDGDPFLVNTYTTNDQRVPEAATDADGNFIVVWESRGADGDPSEESVQAQRFAADGSARGTQFQVNTYTTEEQYRMSVAMDRTRGDFVVAWSSYAYENGDTSYFSIQAQRFAADGDAVGSQFRVNTYTPYSQVDASTAMLAGGDFVVVWQSDGSAGTDSSGYSIQGQRFAADGSPLDDEFQINTYTTSGQRASAVAASADGSFVVVWSSSGSDFDASLTSIQGQRFASSGAPVANQFQINTYTTDSQQAPAVAVAPDGGFLVAWESDGSDTGDTDQDSIQAQRFAPDGSADGGQFQVNTYTTGRQANARVGVDGDGDFVVVWDSFGSDLGDDDRFSVQGRRYAANGDPIGGVFLVNTYTTDAQLNPALAVDEAGDFVVSWEDYREDNGDASDRSIQAQRFRVTADIQGRVFFDMGVDGLRSAGDPGVAGATVHLRDGGGNLLDSTTTDDDGRYHFRPKIAARGVVDQFYLEFEAPASRIFTFQNIGADDTSDSDVDPLTGATHLFILTSAGDRLLHLDAGLTEPPFFADGFESGGTMAWSAAFP